MPARAAGQRPPTRVPTDLNGVVGVTAGASAPEELVDAIIARLDPRDGVEEIRITTEEEYFPPPRELRELLGHRRRRDVHPRRLRCRSPTR